MAEEEVSYASVVFKTNKPARSETKKEEETVYDEVNVQNHTAEQTPDTKAGFLEDKKTDSRRRHYQQLACVLGTLSVLLLSGIIGVCVYLATLSNDLSELNELKDCLKTQMAVNNNLTNLNHNLSSDNESLRRDHRNLRVQIGNLTQAYTVLESNITKLAAENQNLTTQNQKLETQNQKLETQNQKLETEKKILTEQIQNMETGSNELNVSRAQWSVEEYCLRHDGKWCQSCQFGWKNSQSSCYAINDPKPSGRRTWEGAREDCREKSSDLVVVNNEAEKEYVSDNSWDSWGNSGYWIGLRVKDGRWKWVDGSGLADDSWTQQPTDGHCAISVSNEGWKSVSCNNKNRWTCEKKAISV